MAETPISKLRKAVIKNYDPKRGIITAQIDTNSQALPVGKQSERFVQIPFSFYSVDGLFIGGRPKAGTPIIIGEGEGTNWYFVSFMVANVPQIPDMVEGELLIQASKNTFVSLLDTQIDLGGTKSALHLNSTDKKVNNKLQSSFANKLHFTEASREISGIIKREGQNDNTPSELKLTSEEYDKNLVPISLDPSLPSLFFSNDSSKNPPFVEKREMIYEFAYSSNVNDDITETSLYTTEKQDVISNKFTLPNRRQSKTDTLSLSLVSPNFLMESVRGTVVDIMGNILDLNRSPIVGPALNRPNLSLNVDSDKDKAFGRIKTAERQSIAYHFEINARKDLTSINGQQQLPSVDSTTDYARQRSRFYVDIDKEGQFKINVPASSESGNVPLHVRYENYSTFGKEDNNNPNKFIFNDDFLDVYLDSFAIGDIDILDSNATAISPLDRLAKQHIKHGMPFHSISGSLGAFHSDVASQFLNYQTVFKPIDINKLPSFNQIVSPVINVGTNAGGRSGSFHADGSMEISLGANTIDRQSLWADLAGGIVANVGRDKNFISGAVSLDGDLLIQIGGYGISSDSRFGDLNNAFRGGALDIRVMNEGFTVSMLRIDKNGITVMTPNTITYSARKMVFRALEIDMEADRFVVNKRMINKFPPISI